uniref:SCP2 domain-containing protein n=1 Tax=Spongospora subterranea TaxID=70186 RepID=A0A0H5R7B2_9EUKA|eukprot:CRZ10040.1 hypothetical protein [Spongospora subterranea]
MDEVNETLEFLCFSHKKSAKYNGIVTFVLTCPDDQSEHIRSVHVSGDGIRVLHQAHPAPSCVVRCQKDTFLDVYNGELHPQKAVLGGHLHVDGYRYNELRRFLSAFDFSSKQWRQFHQSRDNKTFASSTLDSMLNSWKSMLIPTAHAQSSALSFHLSRRVLTQNVIRNFEQSGASSSCPSSCINEYRNSIPPQSTFSNIQERSRRTGILARAFSDRISRRISASSLSCDHTDFVHRLL